VGEQSRLGEPAVDDPRRHLGGHRTTLTTSTSIGLDDITDDTEARRSILEALAPLLADHLLGLTAALAAALILGDRMPSLLAGKVLRERSSPMPALKRLHRLWRRSGRIGVDHRLLRVLPRVLFSLGLFDREAELIRVDLLRAPPIHARDRRASMPAT